MGRVIRESNQTTRLSTPPNITKTTTKPEILEDSPIEATVTKSATDTAMPDQISAENFPIEATEILSHPDIKYSAETQTLTMTLQFAEHNTKFYLTPEFATWHITLLAALKSHSTITAIPPTHSLSPLNPDTHKFNIIMHLIFPYHHAHTVSNQRAQRSLLKEIVQVFNGNGFEEEKVNKIDVVMKVVKGKVEWNQVKVLAPFWGLRGGYGTWRLFLKEGESKADVVRRGGEWEVRLRAEWRDLVERRDL